MDDGIETLSGQRLATYLWNNYRHQPYKGKYYSKYPKSRYSRVILDNSCVLTGFYIDDSILAPMYEHMDKPNGSQTFRELIDLCLDSYFKACRDDYNHSQSEECFVKDAEANDWEFLSSGELFR